MTLWPRHRSFQARLSGLVALAVGVAIALAAVASYVAVSHQLYRQVDVNLSNDFTHLETQPNPVNSNMAIDFLNKGGVIVGLLTRSGLREVPGAPATLRATPADLEMLEQPGALIRSNYTSTTGQGYRALTSVIKGHRAIVLAEPTATVEHTLATLKLILFIVALGGILLAIGLGGIVARATIRPVKRLTAAAEHVAATQQLEATIVEDSDDELGRLAHAFNEMLGALGASRHQQAQLVSDAGHELRTPLTSLRTNIELLDRARNLPEDDRQELMGDVTAQLEELTTLIGDLVEMARQDEQQPEPTEVRLDHLVEHAVERAQRRAPALRFDVSLTPGSVRAQPPLVERAVLNVLDNAAKWSPEGAAVEVTLTRGEQWYLDIRDHGPGIAADDLPKVFDRFYRAPTARAMPGSGLGLAIVSQVVAAHGGTVTASLPPDGGTLVHIELPTVTEQEPPEPDAVEPPARASGADRPDDGSEANPPAPAPEAAPNPVVAPRAESLEPSAPSSSSALRGTRAP